MRNKRPLSFARVGPRFINIEFGGKGGTESEFAFCVDGRLFRTNRNKVLWGRGVKRKTRRSRRRMMMMSRRRMRRRRNRRSEQEE